MAIEGVSIGSGSSGNSYIIMAGGSVILLDAGLTAKRIMGALEHLDIEPEEVDAVLVTHEHTDHVKSVRAISRKCCNAVFYASRGTVAGTENFKYVPEERLRIIRAGDSMLLKPLRQVPDDRKDIIISTFPLSHDAREPIGFTVKYGSDKLAVVTDTGTVTEEIFEAVSDANKLVFESNHDEHLLMFGEYPYPLKMRIKSDHGHLSNEYAGAVLARLLSAHYERIHPETGIYADTARDEYIDLEEDLETDADGSEDSTDDNALSIMLAHLSEHNNLPLYASQTVESALKESGFRRGVHYKLCIASKETLTIMK